MNFKHPYVVPGLFGAAAIIGIVLIIITQTYSTTFFSNTSDNGLTVTERAVADPLDTVMPFYNDWLNAIYSTSSNPYLAGLDKDGRLSESVKTYIAEAKASNPNGIDPVLCQTNIPPRVGSRVVYALPEKAQIMVIPRGIDKVPESALVDLVPVDGQWQISNISCVNENAPAREFSFEKDGYILKGQAPLDTQYWYAVYEENGQQGYTAPLFFSEASICVDIDGDERTCDTNWFMNPSPAKIKGEMTETGVNVKRIEFTT